MREPPHRKDIETAVRLVLRGSVVETDCAEAFVVVRVIIDR
jgi:hypothetical protein